MRRCQRITKQLARHVFAAIAGAILLAGTVATGQALEPRGAEDADLATVIEAYETFRARHDPVAEARALGDPVRQWGTVGPEAVAARARDARALREQIGQQHDDEQIIDAAILDALLLEPVIAARHDLARIPFTGDHGFHAEPVFAAAQLDISNVETAQAWIDRLNDTPRYFAEHIANMRRGMATGWTAHTDPLATTLDQVRRQVVDHPTGSDLYRPFQNLPDTLALQERERLQREGRAGVKRAIEAYRQLAEFLSEDYAPAARAEPGLASLPGGRAAYRDLLAHHTAGAADTPEDVHQLGKQEVARIRAEMEAVLAEVGFEGRFEAFTTFLRTDPRFYARSPDELIEKASVIAKRLDAILPRYFGRLPRLPYGVSRVPAAIAPGYTTGRYAQGDVNSGRAGSFLVNTYRLDQRPLYALPALTAHEAVPGHHLQIALSQEMDDVEGFRRRYYATAFGEGWALYAERLAGEAGIYRTPYERFGALSYEMWRACRLVADTGLHWYGWSRQQAEACFHDNTALSAHNIQTEVTRYIGWPGQASAYKIGELSIRRLRAETEDALGDAFDLRAFHDHLLGAGAVPLSILEARMRAWTEAQRRATNVPGEAAP